MAGKGLYLVGTNQAYKQPEDAINALVRDQGSVKFALPQEIRFVESGGYRPFIVDRTLRPGSLGLTIGAAPGVSAVIDGALKPSASAAVLVQDHVTNVHLRSLVTRGTEYGVSFMHNADEGVVEGVRCIGHSGWGIHSWSCSRMTVVDCEVWGCRIGIGLHANRGCLVAHNSIYSAPGAGTGVHCGVLLSHEGDMREDENLFNNAIYADGTVCIWILGEDLKDLVSDGNCLYAPGGSIGYIWYPQKTTPTRVIPARAGLDRSLASWRNRTGQDLNSIQAPPGFQRIRPDTSGPAISLAPLATSPLLKKGLHLPTLRVTRSYTEIGHWIEEKQPAIPSWTSSSYLSDDVRGAARGLLPSIGAYERPVQQDDPRNDDPDKQPDDTDTGTLPEAECGDRVSIIDRGVLQEKRRVPCWNPEIHRGYFWVRDMPYYLYAEKEGVTLGDITFSEFDLDVDPEDTGLEVSVGTAAIPSSRWDKHGPRIRIHHKDLEVGHLGDNAVVRGTYLEWDTGIDGFLSKDIRYEFPLAEARRRYILPSVPADAGPVVVTDDTVNPMNDQTHLPAQFRLGAAVPPWGPEVVFRNPNLLRNSAFHYATSGLPDDWEHDTGAAGPDMLDVLPQADAYDIHPFHGDFFLNLESDQWVKQVVRIDRMKAHVLSFHVAAESGKTGEYEAYVDEFDHMKRRLRTGAAFLAGSIEPDTGIDASGPWERVHARIPDPDTGTAYVEVRIAGRDLLLDAVQLEEGTGTTPYVHLPRGEDMTIEYETSDRRFHRVDDLDLSPFRNRMPEGFLHIPAVPARQFDPDAPVDATTVSDWRWPEGRTRHLPWAKAHGMNKWRRVRRWETGNRLRISGEAAFGLRVRQPRVVLVVPDVPVARQGSRGVEVVAEVRNEADNPYAFERVNLSVKETHGRYPGRLARRTYGYFTHLGTEISPESNNRGEVAARYIPPWAEDVEYRGPVPVPRQGVAYVDVPYRVDKTNHGNISLHDRFGTLVDVTGEDVTEGANPRVEGDYSVYDLADRPHFASLTVRESDGDTGWGYPLEETRNALMSEAEYFVNYGTNRVVLSGRRRPIRASFNRRLLWTDRQFPRRVYIDVSALDGLTGEMVIRYDAEVEMTVRADKPAGITRGSPVHRTIPVVVQNPHRGDIR